MKSVVIRNTTTGHLIADRAEVACTMRARIIGLLGRRVFPLGEGLVFPHCNAIHTWGMQMPIDILFLRGTSVIKLAQCLPACRMAAAFQADTVVELPAGTIARTATGIGQVVVVEQGISAGSA